MIALARVQKPNCMSGRQLTTPDVEVVVIAVVVAVSIAVVAVV